MENVICTILEVNTTKEFISSLSKYGDCIDYSNDYERSKSSKGIFAGIVNKVYKPVLKGSKGGHSEHDVVFISSKSLIASKRENQPFRIGFVGAVVNQLVGAKLNEGDAIGILKPSFFYALDVPSLSVGSKNVVVWIGKNVKDSQTSVDVSKSSAKSQIQISRPTKQKDKMVRNRRLPLEDSSDEQSLAESSELSSITLKRDIQIYRSKIVNLNGITNSERPLNKLVPDTTQKSVSEIELSENVVSQNKANFGSTEGSIQNENVQYQFNKCKSISRCVNIESCCSCSNNMLCYKNPHSNICKHQCSCSRLSFCDFHKIPETSLHCSRCNHCCDSRKHCNCSGKQKQCLCYQNVSCGNHLTMSSCWNSGHSCCKDKCGQECCNHNCGLVKQHSCQSHPSGSYKQIFHPETQNNCSRSNICPRLTSCDCCATQNCDNSRHFFCNHSSNSCCSCHNRLYWQDNRKCSHNPKPKNSSDQYEDVSIASNLEADRNNRTKDWVKNWIGNPPCIQALPTQGSHSEFGNICSLGKRKSEKKLEKTTPYQNSKISSMPSNKYGSNPTKEFEKKLVKKKKLFTPQDNSTIISEKSVYNHSTVIEESTPFSSENPTQNTENIQNPVNSTSSESSIQINDCSILNTGNLTQNADSTPTDNLASEENQDFNNLKCVELPLSNSAKSGNVDILSGCFGKTEVHNFVKENSDLTFQPSGTRILNSEKSLTGSSADKNLSEEGLKETNNSSGEQFLELRIDTPLVTPVSETDVEVQGYENSDNCILKNDVQKEVKKSLTDNNPVSLKNNFENENLRTTEEVNSQETTENLKTMENDLVVNFVAHSEKLSKEDEERSNVCNDIPTVTSSKNVERSNSNLSLSLSDHLKSRTVCQDNCEVEEMELTVVNKECSEKRQSEESHEDLMEFTCESKLMKRRKVFDSKEPSKKSKIPNQCDLEENNINIRENSVSSSGTYFDAQSNSSTPESSKRWCLKSYDDVYENENFTLKAEVLKQLGLTPFDSYNLKMYNTFNVVGIVLGVVPKLYPDNYGSFVKGYCNVECLKEYGYEDYKEMEEVEDTCSACRYRFHVACPGCFKKGLTNPLCMYYDFEIHLFDGKNVLRIEVDMRNGINFLGCTPQLYLRNDKMFLKIDEILKYSSPDKWTDASLLKAKVKVISKKGAPVFTLVETSLKKNLVKQKN